MTIRTAALALVLAGATLTAANAASLSVSPLGIALDKQSSSATLTVSNAGDDAVELSAVAYKWSQTGDQPQVLAPTSDIVIYPHQFKLAQLQQHVVRVGLVSKPETQSESAYRIVITELPKLDPSGASALMMRTRMSVPLFVGGAGGTHTLSFGGASATKNGVRVTLNSTGTAHSVVRDIAVDARDAKGAIVSTSHVSGWYLLPGSQQSYTADLPKDACDRIASISLHVTQETGPVIELSGTPERTCAAR